MSGQNALNARRIAENAATVVGVELVCGAQAAEFLDESLALGTGTAATYEGARATVSRSTEDRPLHTDLEAGGELVRSGELTSEVQAVRDAGA